MGAKTAENETANGGEKQPKRKRRIHKYRRKQRSTSIYFFVWAIFSALSLLIVLFCGFTQRFTTVRVYKDAATTELREIGPQIEDNISTYVNGWTGKDLSGFLRRLSHDNDVECYLLDQNGSVLFPQEHFDGTGEGDFSATLEKAKKQMQKKDLSHVVCEGDGEFVYVAEIEIFGGPGFLYITKSVALIESASTQLGVHTMLTLVFTFLLSFAVSSAFSAWLTKPLTELTEKARMLAEGNFDVDFRGSEYGKELVELAESLNFAKEELSKTDRMQKELIANVSHDFKTPLTMIKAYASMIIEISGDYPEKRNKHAQVIVDEADRLTSLVNDVLDLSKLNADMAGLKAECFDLSAYVYEILDRFAYLKDVQGYRFQADIEEKIYICGDRLRLGQVVYNLIGNAVNYTGEDKTVFVRLQRVSSGLCRFSVTDTGKGIPEEEINGIWERYYRSKEAHKRPVQGTGLGLSIVKTILQKHGVEFGVESEVGKGSTFYVLFSVSEDGTTE